MRKFFGFLLTLAPMLALASSFSQLGSGPITITAATLQAATNGHAYWINVNTGALIDAGTNIAAANPTNQPPTVYDLSSLSNAMWSLSYGTQTGAAACKIGIAELWPTQPVEVVGTIPPYVRDAASHYVLAGGVAFPVQDRIPGDFSVVLDQSTAANASLSVTGLFVQDYRSLWIETKCSGASTADPALNVIEVSDDGVAGQGFGVNGHAVGDLWQHIAWGLGTAATGSPFGSFTGHSNAVPYPVPRRINISVGAAGVGITQRVRVLGELKQPARRVAKVTPYIQCATFPSSASNIYLELWGGT